MRVMIMSFSVGAMAHYAACLANSLVQNGNQVMVLVNSEAPDDLFDNRVVVEKFKVPQFLKMKELAKLIFFPGLYFSVGRLIKNFLPDVIHFNSSHWYFRYLILLTKNTPSVVTIHDVYAHPGTSESVEEFKKRPMISKCNSILVHSHNLKKQAVDKWKLSEEKVEIVPFAGCSTDNWKKYADKPSLVSENKIFFFGRIRKYKGLDVLLKSFELILKQVPGCQLVIAGQGELEIPEGLKNITFLNEFISDAHAAEIAAGCSIIAAPYIEATASTLPIIAGIFRKPIVASQVGCFCKYVKSGETGMLVPPGDHKAFAEACVSILKNPDKAEQMGIAAEKYINDLASPKIIAEHHIGVYHSIQS